MRRKEVPRAGLRPYAGRRVDQRECPDGRLLVFTDVACVGAQPGPAADCVLRPRHSPSADRSQGIFIGQRQAMERGRQACYHAGRVR